MSITLKQIAQEIRTLANEKPDFIYRNQPIPDPDGDTTCSYLGAQVGQVGGEACIVGQALSRVGIPDDLLRAFERAGAYHALSSLVVDEYIDVEEYDAFDENRILSWVDAVQFHQDSNKEWSVSIKLADATETH